LREENLKPKKRKRRLDPARTATVPQRKKTTVTAIQQPAVRGNRATDTASERDFLLNVLRTAAARQRLATNAIETIGTALRNKLVDCEEAMKWAHEEGVINYLVLGPTGGAK
jgi:hypothetical protein